MKFMVTEGKIMESQNSNDSNKPNILMRKRGHSVLGISCNYQCQKVLSLLVIFI